MASIVASYKKMRTFLGETRAEVKKCTFPSRDEVVGTTIVVLIASVIFAFYLWLADIVIAQVYRWISQVIGS